MSICGIDCAMKYTRFVDSFRAVFFLSTYLFMDQLLTSCFNSANVEGSIMKKIIENFRHFQEQENTERTSDIESYKMIGLLVIAKRMSRNKKDIISDIRAIEGVTTVTLDSQRESDSLGFSEIMIKIDTTPFSTGTKQGLLKIKHEITQVKGVQSFKIVSKSVIS